MLLLLTLFHVVVCIALVMIVLLQKGKGASMGAAFGGSSQTVFGSSGATPFLGKVTVAAAVIFMFTSLSLALLMGRGGSSSLMKGVNVPAATQPVEGQAPAGSPAPAQSQAPAQSEAPAGSQSK
jgi:preprotein translocase subunit SecG